jgi:hypothetical protein
MSDLEALTFISAPIGMARNILVDLEQAGQ